MNKAFLAIAIEDRIDLWFTRQEDGEAEIKLPPRDIPEGGNYFNAVHALLTEQLAALLEAQPSHDPADIFNSITETVVSTPGVVHEKRELRQLPLWHFEGTCEVRWRHEKEEKRFFNFREELTSIAAALIADRSKKTWGATEQDRFNKKVTVVNDATACAAFEHGRRSPQQRDFVYLKLHTGVNCGIVQRSSKDLFIKLSHGEVGHSFPVAFKQDHEANFLGVCPAHPQGCFEGMLAAHSYKRRAEHPVFAGWQRHVADLEARALRGQRLDSALQHLLLDGSGEAVELVAHYAGQLVYQIALSPLAPEQIVIGGRMAKPSVLQAIRENVMLWSNGYPARDDLTPTGITRFIVPTLANPGQKHDIEVGGALTIARADPRSQVLVLHSSAKK